MANRQKRYRNVVTDNLTRMAILSITTAQTQIIAFFLRGNTEKAHAIRQKKSKNR